MLTVLTRPSGLFMIHSPTTKRIANGDLTSTELESSASALGASIKRKETRQWIEWTGLHEPVKSPHKPPTLT
jgi:hypothetical protein